MFADDVVLYARENDVMEFELEPWREALETRGMKVSSAKAEYMCLNGMPLISVNMQSAKLPQVIEFKYNMYGLATYVGDETKTTQEYRLWRW